jgi:UDP-glucose 4-epimerase
MRYVKWLCTKLRYNRETISSPGDGMTVLVTGGAGYIGGQMVLALADAGEKIVVLDDLSTGFRAAVSPPAKLIVGDVGDAALVERILAEHKIDAIAHFAAKIVVPESIGDPLRYYLNNTAKARTLMECAVRETSNILSFPRLRRFMASPPSLRSMKPFRLPR